MQGSRRLLTPMTQAAQGFLEPALEILPGLVLVVPVLRRVQQVPVSVMTSLTTERVILVAGSVRGTFERLSALFYVYCEPCSSGD